MPAFVGFPRPATTSIPCRVVTWTSTAVTCDAPAGIDGSPAITVAIGGQSTTATLLHFAPPTVSTVSPAVGVSTAGGSTVLVVGSDIPSPGMGFPVAVTIGTVVTQCDWLSGSAAVTTMRCRVPPGSGSVPVVVHTASQSSSGDSGLQYAVPSLSAISPPSAVDARCDTLPTVVVAVLAGDRCGGA